METLPGNEEDRTIENNIVGVENEANFEGNDAILLFERVGNPIIKNQIINLLYRQEKERYDFYTNEEWEPFLPEGWTGGERIKLLKGKRSGEVINEGDLNEELSAPVPSKERVEAELNTTLGEIQQSTDVDFTSNQPNAEIIPLNWIVPWTGEKATAKQMSIIEAHEKGHRIRDYDELTEEFKNAFDISNVDFTPRDHEILRKDAENHTDQPIDADEEMTFEDARDRYLNHYLFMGSEIAERMSQLKNYFGFKGAEEFTKAHLDYAREHYIEDTGMDNGMSLFFQGITNETEDVFIDLINSLGI